jgi:hypothetical protein
MLVATRLRAASTERVQNAGRTPSQVMSLDVLSSTDGTMSGCPATSSRVIPEQELKPSGSQRIAAGALAAGAPAATPRVQIWRRSR